MTNGRMLLQLVVLTSAGLLLAMMQQGCLVVAAADGKFDTRGECRKLDSCRCEYPDGRGIDMTNILEKTDSYLFTIDPFTQDEYFFHPCFDIKYLPPGNGSAACSNDGYALCRKPNDTSVPYQRLGTVKESNFRSSEDGKLFLVFKVDNITTTIQLFCLDGERSSEKSYLFFESYEKKVANPSSTNILLFSTYACPITIEEISSSSVGSVLLILFLIGTFTYFTIGSIVRFMYLGARGIEVIPNLDFWKDLPGLVRDGVRFLQNGCRVEQSPNPDSYDAI